MKLIEALTHVTPVEILILCVTLVVVVIFERKISELNARINKGK